MRRRGNFKYAIARYNGIYGPRQSTDLKNGSIIPVLIERAKKYPETEYTILTKELIKERNKNINTLLQIFNFDRDEILDILAEEMLEERMQ